MQDVDQVISQFVDKVRKEVPCVDFRVERGLTADHMHWIDLTYQGVQLVIQYSTFRNSWGIAVLEHRTKPTADAVWDHVDYLYPLNQQDEAAEHAINLLLQKA